MSGIEAGLVTGEAKPIRRRVREVPFAASVESRDEEEEGEKVRSDQIINSLVIEKGKEGGDVERWRKSTDEDGWAEELVEPVRQAEEGNEPERARNSQCSRRAALANFKDKNAYSKDKDVIENSKKREEYKREKRRVCSGDAYLGHIPYKCSF